MFACIHFVLHIRIYFPQVHVRETVRDRALHILNIFLCVFVYVFVSVCECMSVGVSVSV